MHGCVAKHAKTHLARIFLLSLFLLLLMFVEPDGARRRSWHNPFLFCFFYVLFAVFSFAGRPGQPHPSQPPVNGRFEDQVLGALAMSP